MTFLLELTFFDILFHTPLLSSKITFCFIPLSCAVRGAGVLEIIDPLLQSFFGWGTPYDKFWVTLILFLGFTADTTTVFSKCSIYAASGKGLGRAGKQRAMLTNSLLFGVGHKGKRPTEL